jgi:CheY-like chemotaxis protein
MNEQEKTRVLIVEDNSLISEVIKGLLEEAGYTVVGEAADGLEAVEMTQSLRPDVVLMDIMMPDMDGIEATRLIYERCPTPVVVLTAYHTPEMVERANAAGAGAFLVKPAHVREMEHAITIAIARFGDI